MVVTFHSSNLKSKLITEMSRVAVKKQRPVFIGATTRITFRDTRSTKRKSTIQLGNKPRKPETTTPLTSQPLIRAIDHRQLFSVAPPDYKALTYKINPNERPPQKTSLQQTLICLLHSGTWWTRHRIPYYRITMWGFCSRRALSVHTSVVHCVDPILCALYVLRSITFLSVSRNFRNRKDADEIIRRGWKWPRDCCFQYQ